MSRRYLVEAADASAILAGPFTTPGEAARTRDSLYPGARTRVVRPGDGMGDAEPALPGPARQLLRALRAADGKGQAYLVSEARGRYGLVAPSDIPSAGEDHPLRYVRSCNWGTLAALLDAGLVVRRGHEGDLPRFRDGTAWHERYRRHHGWTITLTAEGRA